MSSHPLAGASAPDRRVAIGVISRKQVQAQVLKLVFSADPPAHGRGERQERNLFANLWEAPRFKRWPVRFAIRRALTRAQEADLRRELAEIEAAYRP
ncbi:hypothetical protein [Pseudoruegeria sp. SHC-113]|uniref:hypothetical protein n=1 Tax=Pseudoruegeria sp. SHC-113 TaxID=2855439 RepID=UPI0021BAFAA1|nr:hypothetical protein [Pseudoruegeria sp. SHC-113]MCT8158468.1 hypothetical protein [Pseudoruegeria sp. SHC-113]